MRRYLFLISVFAITLQLSAQYQNVLISTSSSPNEPSIVINPKNPDQLLAGANIRSYYYSFDGGYNWTRGDLVSEQNGVWGDPCLIVDTAGSFYFFHLSNPPEGTWIDRIVCQKFNTETLEWNDGSYMGLNGTKNQDKEWAVVDSATNTIYSTWTQFDLYGSSNSNNYSNIMFSKSEDGGLTWTDAMRINEVSGDCIDSDNTTEGAVPAVGPNGEVYVAWSGPAGIVFDRSLDGGETWLDEDIFIDSQPTGWDYSIPGINRANGLPITCCDISHSSYRGNIYVNWSDQRNGADDTDVWFSKSTDGGNTWTEAKRVNNDPAGKQQFFTWMTIDQANGTIYMVFYDRRNYSDINTDVYLARSTDGGEIFENILISESPFYPSSGVFFGDYTNITAYNNRVRPIWGRADGANMSLWTAIIDMSVGVQRPDEIKPFSLAQNYPNPFVESTYYSFEIKEPSLISLNIYDVFGRLITNLINNQFTYPGEYNAQFNAREYNLGPGVYWLVLNSNQKVEKRQMVLVE
jgi:hypothetical protein